MIVSVRFIVFVSCLNLVNEEVKVSVRFNALVSNLTRMRAL